MDKQKFQNLIEILDKEYKEYSISEIKDMLVQLSKLSKKAVITDIKVGNKLGVMSYDGKEFFSYFRTIINAKYHGSGDVFASSFVGALCNDIDLKKSLKIAVDFTWESIKETHQNHQNAYGLDFESKLPYYIHKLKKDK